MTPEQRRAWSKNTLPGIASADQVTDVRQCSCLSGLCGLIGRKPLPVHRAFASNSSFQSKLIAPSLTTAPLNEPLREYISLAWSAPMLARFTDRRR